MTQITKLLQDAQAILEAFDNPQGPSKAETIMALNALLRTPTVNLLIATAEFDMAKQVAEACAQFGPALIAAEHKLEELRPSYTGSAVVSIDRVLEKLRDAKAKAGAK